MSNQTLREIVAPTAEVRARRLETFKQYACYLVIFMIEIITVFIIPIIAGGVSTKDWDYWIPSTVMGWVCWWAMKVGTIVGNIAVFALFKTQGKTNAKDNPNYIEANELLSKQVGKKGFIPRSPTQYQTGSWLTKGLSITVITAAESVVIGSLIIAWDLMTFISCIVSSITAIIFGIVQMIKDEVYWTDEYLQYAKYVSKEDNYESM